MARRNFLSNPTGLETTLLTITGVVLGTVGGFTFASWVCGKVFVQATQTGALDPSVVSEEVEQGLAGMQQPDDEILMLPAWEYTLGRAPDGRIQVNIYDPEGQLAATFVRATLERARNAAIAYARRRDGVATERPYVSIS